MNIAMNRALVGLIILVAITSNCAWAQQPPASGSVTTTTTTVKAYSLAELKDKPISADQMKIEIGYIESHVKMPDGAKPIEQYARYYAQDKNNGFIHGAYVPVDAVSGWSAGSHIVDYDKLPGVADGGCSFVDVIFIRKMHGLRASCHGLA